MSDTIIISLGCYAAGGILNLVLFSFLIDGFKRAWPDTVKEFGKPRAVLVYASVFVLWPVWVAFLLFEFLRLVWLEVRNR